GLDADAMVAEYNQGPGAKPEIVSTRPSVTPRGRDLAVTPGMIVGAALLVILGIFGFYLKSQLDTSQATRASAVHATTPLQVSSGKARITHVTVNGKDLGTMPPKPDGAGNQTYGRSS